MEVFSDPSAGIVPSEVEVTAFFLLHGRLSSSKSVERIAESLIQLTRAGTKLEGSKPSQRDLIVITFVGLQMGLSSYTIAYVT